MLPVRPEVLRLRPYVPGKPIREVQREYGLTDVVKLASNENPLGPPPKAVEAIRKALSGLHIYPEGSSPELRGRVAERLGFPADWVMVGNGSDELLRLLAASYVQAGDHCVVPGESFPNYRAVSELFGARVTEVPLRAGAMDLEAMAAAASVAPTRIIWLCRPNNPTGGVFAAEAFERFMAAVPSTAMVVVDEAYHEFDETGFDALAVLKRYPNLVVTRTFSKAYGLAALRVGYGIARPEVWQPCYTVREPFTVGGLGQVAALAALDDEEHLAATRKLAREGKRFLEELCVDLGLRYLPSQANFVMIDLGRPAQPVFEALLRRGVIVRPCTGFGRPEFIRVTTGRPEELMRFASALKEAVQSGG